MAEWLPGLVGGIVAALIASSGGWWYIRANQRKTMSEAAKSEAEARKLDADTVDVFTETALRLVAEQNKRIAEMQTQNKLLMERVKELEIQVAGLRLQVRDVTGKHTRLIKQLAVYRTGTEVLAEQLGALDLTPDWQGPED